MISHPRLVGVLPRYRLIRYGNQVKVKAPKMASLTFTLEVGAGEK